MSKVSIEGNASGTGTLTIAAPNTNTNYTLTLPTNSGTIITGTLPDGDLVGTTATQTLTNKSIVATQLTGTIAAAQLPAGSVLQVVQTVKTDTTSTTSTTLTDISGMSVTITPSSATSKVLILMSMNNGASTGTLVGFALTRGGTKIANGDAAGNRPTVTIGSYPGATSNAQFLSNGQNFLDSPNTTSSTTYQVQWKTENGTIYLNRSARDGDNTTDVRSISTITVMEIAG